MVSCPSNPILMDLPWPIETPRLLLRPIQPGDGAALFAAKQESFPELSTWMPWAKELGGPEDTEIWARESYAACILRKDICIVGLEKATGKWILNTGLHHLDWQTRCCEIGYWVRTSETGKGYATESTNALLRYAFGALSARKVVIAHAAGNDASRRVIEKLGFAPEGVMKGESFLPSGRIVDTYRYARFDTQGLPDLAVSWG